VRRTGSPSTCTPRRRSPPQCVCRGTPAC
jgi:hypothetical protein